MPKNCSIYILDDDPSVGHIWKNRFQNQSMRKAGISLSLFSSGTDLCRSFPTLKVQGNELFLFDFELLGEEKTGIEIIQELGIEKNAILVTSRFEEEFVRTSCDRLGVKLIPKGLAGFVPVRLMDS